MVRTLMEQVYFNLCRVLGRILRSGRYSTVLRICGNGGMQIQKQRFIYAPLLIQMGNLLFGVLGMSVRVLPPEEWAVREAYLYRVLYGSSIQRHGNGTLVLPYLPGETLASVLEDSSVVERVRNDAIQQAVIALAVFHRLGFTHGDATSENVLIERITGVCHWFDFETIHDVNRPMEWRCADDLRALLFSCLVRTVPEKYAETCHLILDAYANHEVIRLLAKTFTSVWHQSLMFHLAQANLSFVSFQEMTRLLKERLETL